MKSQQHISDPRLRQCLDQYGKELMTRARHSCGDYTSDELDAETRQFWIGICVFLIVGAVGGWLLS